MLTQSHSDSGFFGFARLHCNRPLRCIQKKNMVEEVSREVIMIELEAGIGN